MRWAPARFTARTEVDGETVRVVVEAASVVRDLLLQPDRVSAEGVVDRGFVTLLPGEAASFLVTSAVDIDESSFEQPWVVSSANALVATSVQELTH